MEIAIKILEVIGTILSVLTAYKAIFFVVGLFKKKTFPSTENKHKYAICVAARNEEKVIENLLESILKQDYPLESLSVFVLAHNCTDKTAQTVRAFNEKNPQLDLHVYKYDNDKERTKGYALKYLFERIEEDYSQGVETFEGYVVFDADNVLKRNFMTKINEAYDAGNKIIVTFRNSKNMNQNWISFSYAMHWLRTCLNESRAKAVLNQACRVQGTGFLFTNEIVKNGWPYVTLTEDRSFCTDAVVQNYKISYCEDAEFYDEQPYKLKVAFRQRIRWAKGHLQSFAENMPKLLRNLFKKDKSFCTTYDSIWMNFPSAIESLLRGIIKFGLSLAVAIIAHQTLDFFTSLVIGYFTGYALKWLSCLFVQILILLYYRKRVGQLSFWKTLFNMLMFPSFDIIGKWSMYIAFVTKVEWKAIPHDVVVDVDKMNK